LAGNQIPFIMKPTLSRQRVYALLLMLGASILLFMTIRMMAAEQAFELLVPWVIALLIAEFLIDLGCFLAAVRWFVSGKRASGKLPLRLGASAALLHALRVLVYVLGRTGPWINFDVKPEHHEAYTFEWFWVYVAATLAVLGVIGVMVIWQIIRIKARSSDESSGKLKTR